jgi:selenocysteine lyase/cysteine desulfurase
LLYVRRDVLNELAPPILDLHAAQWTAPDRYLMRPDTRRFETWECNVAAKLGLGAALDYAMSWGLPAIRDRIYWLADDLRNQLSELPGVRVHDVGAEQCGIVTFTVVDLPAEQVKELLSSYRINVNVSRTASTRLDMESRGLDELVRASVHYYNTTDELEGLCRVLRERNR